MKSQVGFLFQLVDQHLKIQDKLIEAWPCSVCKGEREVGSKIQGTGEPCSRCWGEGWEIPDSAHAVIVDQCNRIRERIQDQSEED